MAYLTRLNLARVSPDPANHSTGNTKPRIQSIFWPQSAAQALSLAVQSFNLTSTSACSPRARPSILHRIVSSAFNCLEDNSQGGICFSFSTELLVSPPFETVRPIIFRSIRHNARLHPLSGRHGPARYVLPDIGFGVECYNCLDIGVANAID